MFFSMAPSCLLPVRLFLLLLLSLPSSIYSSSGHGLFFATHSSRPWSHRQRWHFPFAIPSIDRFSQNPSCHGRIFDANISESSNTSMADKATEQEDHSRATAAARYGSHIDGIKNISEIRVFGVSEEINIDGACHGLKAQGMIGYVKLKVKQAARTAGLIIWLLVLFYLLGTTASDYFSCTLEMLSSVLNLSPAVAGVTLLAVGNGAPDVFASVLAFASSDRTGSIGFGSVLGGALFITTVVSGTVALVTARVWKESKRGVFRRNGSLSRKNPFKRTSSTVQNAVSGTCVEVGLAGLCDDRSPTLVSFYSKPGSAEDTVKVDMISFIRDVIFLLIAVGVLSLILMDGKIHLWEAIIFICVYPVYAAFVWIVEILQRRHRSQRSSLLDPLYVRATIEDSLPQWSDVHEVQQHAHHYHVHSQELEADVERLWENPSDHSVLEKLKHLFLQFYKYCIERPFSIPRRLTIPIVEDERWSKKVAVASCMLAPIFVAAVWALNNANSTASVLIALGISGGVGIQLGLLAYMYTDEAQPPQQCLTLWLAGGFFMSIVWFYVVANELVTALESLGYIFGISDAILGLTVLAWGNSVGDLVADLALACSGPDGVQIAISACYAGPLFNTVIGLGLSLLLGCSKSSPEPFLIADKDGSLFYIMGFLAIGLIWALVMLPLRGMRLGRIFGIGLIVLYGSFFVIAICYAIGWST